ncbi:MAG TPA: hypothetical protein VHK69_11650, partial [Chitinophagaceae bacterium]|nr:hypothetical protein [Chitinophagaceae bacterium]
MKLWAVLFLLLVMVLFANGQEPRTREEIDQYAAAVDKDTIFQVLNLMGPPNGGFSKQPLQILGNILYLDTLKKQLYKGKTKIPEGEIKVYFYGNRPVFARYRQHLGKFGHDVLFFQLYFRER